MSGGAGLRRFVASTAAQSQGQGESTATQTPTQADAQTDGAQTDGAQTDGAQTDGAQTDGAHTDGAHTDGAQTDGALAHAEPADARATLSAALGRPLEPTGQPASSPGAGAGAATDEIEKCELCSTVIPAEHGHLADLESSHLMCACRACYLLFTNSDVARGRYRAIPDRYLTDPEHPISTMEWDALEIPVGLAFFLHDSRTGHVTGFYPSPAGATECRLDLQAWADLTGSHPLLAAAEPDVEAILISRPSPRAESASGQGQSVETFVVPIDACYELAGRMRLYWRGFDGGSEAKSSITEFLDTVRTRARALDQGA